jgi:BlaI family penicillinase repressor
MPRGGKPALSQLEHTVMVVIWKHGQATAESLRTTLGGVQPMKDSTVRTILRRLEAKGYVRHKTVGRTYVYSPAVAPHRVAADAVRRIIERFCQGSVENLLVGMVDREIVSPEKLRELAQRIAKERISNVGESETKRRRARKGT